MYHRNIVIEEIESDAQGLHKITLFTMVCIFLESF